MIILVPVATFVLVTAMSKCPDVLAVSTINEDVCLTSSCVKLLSLLKLILSVKAWT